MFVTQDSIRYMNVQHPLIDYNLGISNRVINFDHMLVIYYDWRVDTVRSLTTILFNLLEQVIPLQDFILIKLEDAFLFNIIYAIGNRTYNHTLSDYQGSKLYQGRRCLIVKTTNEYNLIMLRMLLSSNELFKDNIEFKSL